MASGCLGFSFVDLYGVNIPENKQYKRSRLELLEAAAMKLMVKLRNGQLKRPR